MEGREKGECLNMESKAVLGLMLMLLLTCVLVFAVNVQPAKTNETTTAQTQQKVGTLSEVGPPIQWNKTYGGAAFDWAWSMVRTSDGGYALAGRTKSFGAGGVDDFWLVKTNGDGNMQWSRTYGGTGYDYAYSVVQTTDGGYAIAGTIEGSGSDYNFWLVKTDSLGNMQWNAVYGGSRSDYAYSVIQTSDGGYALAGETWISSSQCAFWLVKTDSSGNMQWSHTYGGAYCDSARSVIQTSDGGYAIVGTTQPSSTAYSDVWLVRTDSYGNVLWDKKYLGTGSANDYGYSVIQTSDGGYAIAGSTQVSGIPEYEMLLLKTDSNGNVQWMGKYAISYYDRACSVIQTNDGGYAIAGYYTSENAYYGALKKIYANGTEQWERRLWDGAIVSVVQTADGGYALGGSTNKYSAGDYDFWLIKVAPETPTVDWWPMFGHDARRTGASTSTAPNTNDTLWTFELYTTHMGGPVAADGIVFIGPDSPNDKIYALNATTGEVLWNVTVGGGSSSFAVSGGTVYVSNQGSHKLYAFNELTGNLLWSFTTTGNPGGPLISEGMVFFSTWWEGKIYALNASTGSLLWSWQTPAGTKAIAGPAVADGMVFFSSAFDGVVYCFDEFTGTPKWNFTHGAYSDNTAAVVDGIVFIGGGSSGVFYALNETNGQLIWSYSTGADLHTSPSIHNGKVFFGANNGKVYALNTSTGSLLWSYQTGDVVCGPVIYADGKVFFTSRDRKVYALNESTGSLIWSYDTSRRTEPGLPIVANGILYVPTGVWYESAQISYLIAFGPVPTGYFKLTITSTIGGTTSPSGIKIYPAGSNVNVQALPNTGYYLDHWELDGANIGSSNPITITMNSNHNLHAVFMQIPYDVTINAHCDTEGVDISVPITMDGSPTGYNTPHTFTGLTGTHTFTVPNTDPSGHPFKQWSTGETSTTITVNTGGTYTAYYETPTPPPPGVGGIVIPVDKFALLAPYIGLTSTIIVAAVVSVVYVKRVKRRKEKQ
jgi:outer membrane protein assembly factor BamB